MVSTVRENHSRPMTQTNLRRDQAAVLRTLFICSVGNEKDNIQPSNQKDECEGKASRAKEVTTNWLDMSQEQRYGIHIGWTSRSIHLRTLEP